LSLECIWAPTVSASFLAFAGSASDTAMKRTDG
jgi:hypothetical protein